MQYMLLIFAEEGGAPTPEDGPAFEAYMAPWMAYTQSLQEAGVMVSGEPLEGADTATKVRRRDGKRVIEDGPFIDSKEQLGGFYIIDVPTLDQAIEWAAKCPAAAYGTMEVRPIWQIPGAA